MLSQIKPNTIPLPHPLPSPACAAAEAPPAPEVKLEDLPNDRFSKGRITKYLPYHRSGFIQTSTGKEIYFNLDEIELVKEGPISVGTYVGYDPSRTSHGLRVKRMKVY